MRKFNYILNLQVYILPVYERLYDILYIKLYNYLYQHFQLDFDLQVIIIYMRKEKPGGNRRVCCYY